MEWSIELKIGQQSHTNLKLRGSLGIVSVAKAWKDEWSFKEGCYKNVF